MAIGSRQNRALELAQLIGRKLTMWGPANTGIEKDETPTILVVDISRSNSASAQIFGDSFG